MYRFLPLLWFVSFILISFQSSGQKKADTTAVLKPIHQLFEGMEKNDSSLVSKVLLATTKLLTVNEDSVGNSSLSETDIKKFLITIGSPKEITLKEDIFNIKVSMEENVASVWCDYNFYIDDNLHHCGIDLFLLLKTTEGWKIRQIVDTRKTENCQSKIRND